ncbi:MAG: hypothetical protein A2V74_07760 [Acidobacteria bacterium RBG_16_70_10]|nr:MAG: hypothetical protein A2V74_07760 [Acidobacteria bacterium RBG_16_70_10]
MRDARSLTLALAAMLAASFPPGAAAATRPAVRDFLRRAGFTLDQLAALDRGQAITRRLGAEVVAPNETAEFAAFGAVRVDMPRELFAEAVRSIEGFRYEGMQRVTMIGNPPQPSDFAALSLPPEDVKDLRDCRPGACALKLAGPNLAELKARIDWKARDHAEQVNRFAREQLLAAMRLYVGEGTAAFKPLEDKSSSISIDQQLRELLGNTPELLAYYPELHEYVLEYPRRPRLARSQELFYWSLNEFGLKPTLTVTHVVGYAPEGSEDVVVVWKQLYASHYFNGGLAVTTYARDPEGAYVVHLDRVRADGLGGMFGGVKRSKIAGAAEKTLRKFLEATRANLQARVRRP